MDPYQHPASRLGNLVHKNPYVQLHLQDASDQEFMRSEFQREQQQQQNISSTAPNMMMHMQSSLSASSSASTSSPSSGLQRQHQQQQKAGINKTIAPAGAPSVDHGSTSAAAAGAHRYPANDTGRSSDSNMVQELHAAGGPLMTGQGANGVGTGGAATVQTMVEGAVRLVTMLNFMKVELGDRKTLRSKEQWRAAGAEFIGTLLFVYLGCGSVVATGMLATTMTAARLVAIALAHGLAIAFLAGATGAISGGHLNPAVTLAFVIAGKETLLRAGLYVGAQLFGAVIGAALLKGATPMLWSGGLGSHDLSNGLSPGQGFLMEIMLTFVLVFVIFGVAVDRRGPGVIAPLPIGFAVLVDHLVGVPYTGASMNPARSFGPAMVSGTWSSTFWIYWLGPCFGATFASALYRYIFLEPVIVLSTTIQNNAKH